MHDPNDVPLSEPLTEREQAVLRLMTQGLSNRQIAEELILSLDTIKWYTKRLYEKLDVSSRTQAIAKAEMLGLLEKQTIAHKEHSTHPSTRLNLPVQATRFIGREAELNDLGNLLSEPHVRLVTIVAPGGMGKTRLALETATLQDINFADGVYFIPLAPLTSAEHIVPAIGDVVGIHFYGGMEPKQQLLNFLRTKSVLLVMDNFEHLINGVQIISDILAAAPDVKILVTSREALNLQEEYLYTLNGMGFPEPDLVENLEGYSAIKLFVQHARRIRADFSLSNEQVGAAQICALVEGMPLGIELAATWVRALSCAEIANEIRSSLDILATPVRNVPERHRNIRAVLEQSWKRLTSNEQAVFKKLSIFRGGFTRQAAQVVAGATLPTLAALVDKSLIRHHFDERYDIHELLRQYGEEQLNLSSEESEQTRDRHCSYYAQFMGQCEADVKGRRQLPALKEIEIEFENVRAAWLWALGQKNEAAINQALECLCLFCEMRGRFVEGKELLWLAQETFTANPLDEPPRIWGRLFTRWAHLQLLHSGVLNDEAIQMRVDRSLKLAQKHEETGEIAFCQWILGLIAGCAGNSAEAIPPLEISFALYHALDDRYSMAQVADYLAVNNMKEGQREKFDQWVAQSLDLRRQIGDRYGAAITLQSAAGFALEEGRFAEAERGFQEIGVIHSEMGNRTWLVRNNVFVAWLAFLRGDFEKISILANEALEILPETPWGGKWMLIAALGMIANMEEDYASGRVLSQQAAAYRSFAWVGLAVAANGLGDYPLAKQHLQSWLAFRIPPHSLSERALGLPVAAILATHDGHLERAVELLGLAFNHPASSPGWLEKWPLLTRLRADLEKQLGPQIYEASWERGKSLDLETVAASLLSDMSG